MQIEFSREKYHLRSLAVPWGGCANAGVSFFLARCARGGGKWSETELALMYVRSLCRWAWLAVLGAAASDWKRNLR